MPENTTDWDIGQKLIELEYVSLEQVREALAIQDKLREMGLAPKSVTDILQEKGTLTAEQAGAVQRKTTAGIEIPGYRLHQRVGSGGMGMVFRATQLSFGRTVAVKILPPKYAKDPKYIERFFHEARSVARLSHPNLVAGIDVGGADGVYYFVMEFVEGRTARQLLEERGRWDEVEALQVVLQVAQALDHAHRNKMIHGDVKPANIMIMPDGLARLCDLGLAREERKGPDAAPIGSPAYMSPEQVRGEELDTRSDVYSLGATLYHLLTGAIPFRAARPEEIPAKHVKEPLVPPAKVCSGISPEVSSLVVRMMEKDRERRIPSPFRVAQEIETILAARRKPKTVTRRVRRRAWAASPSLVVPFVLILACVAVAGWVYLRSRKSGEAGPTDSHPRADRASEESPLDREAKEELDELGRKQDLDPSFDHAAEILAGYRHYRTRYVGKKWEGRASRDEASYRRRLEEAARAALEEIRRTDPELRRDERWAELIRLYRTFPEKFRNGTESGRTVQGEIDSLQSRIRERYARDKAEVGALISVGKIDEAERRVRDMQSYLGEEERKDHAEFLALVERKKVEAAEAARRGSLERYLALDGPLRQAMGARDYRAAAAIALKFLDEEKPAGLDVAVLRGLVDGWQCRELVRVCDCDPAEPASLSAVEGARLDLRNAAILDLFLGDAAAGLEHAAKAGPREKYRIAAVQGKLGYFQREGEKLYFWVENDRRTEFHVTRTPTESDLIQLASRGLDVDRAKSEAKFEESAAHQTAAGLLYHFSGTALAVKARVHFEKALKLGASGVRIYLAGIRAAEEARLRAELTQAWERAQAHHFKKQYVEARAAIDELLRHADHEFVKSRRDSIDRMLGDVDAALTRTEKLAMELRGRVAFTERGEVRVTYDFEDKNQLEVFESVPKLKGQWRWQKGALESSGDAAAIRWIRRVHGDLTVEFDLGLLEDPQNLVTDLYYRAGEKNHYAVTFGFDWVGRSLGDTDNTAEDRNGMPRTCILKYPIEVDVEKWVLPAQWEIWKSRLVGQAKSEFKLRRGQKPRVRIERRGKSLRLSVDGTPVWEGEDGDYTEGDVLFFADSRARIDDLTITFPLGK